MKKIELTEMEKNLIEKHLKYEIGYYTPKGEPIGLYNLNYTEDEIKSMNALISKAEALEEELDAFDERMDEFDSDLLLWYWKKYQKQLEEK